MVEKKWKTASVKSNTFLLKQLIRVWAAVLALLQFMPLVPVYSTADTTSVSVVFLVVPASLCDHYALQSHSTRLRPLVL